MDLDWLEDFLVLTKTGSFSSAANNRNISQPAFSRRIRALEQWIGMPLLDRSTYPATLTNSGKTLRDTAEEVVRLLHRTREECRTEFSRDNSEISFSGLHTLALTFFPKWLKQSEKELGLVKTRMMAGNVHDCVQSLVLKHCDFLLYYAHHQTPFLLDGDNFLSVKLAAEKLIPVSATDNDGKPLFELENNGKPLPYLAYTSDTFLGKIVALIQDNLNTSCELQVRYSNSMSEALKTMTLEGHGLAWLPESCIKREFQHNELVQIGNEHHCLEMEIHLVRNSSRLQPEAERLWSWLMRQKKTMPSNTDPVIGVV